jgi:hypothetical protein
MMMMRRRRTTRRRRVRAMTLKMMSKTLKAALIAQPLENKRGMS